MRRILAVLVLTLLPLLFAGPASAGGPTSVLLVVPGTGQIASLYLTDPDYSALSDLVGADGGVSGEVSSAGHESGTSVTLTWLIHDVQVWRVDRVYLDAEGGPWIATQSAFDGETSLWDAPLLWHPASDGAQLAALLDRLGVDGSGTAPASAVEGAGGVAAPAAAAVGDGAAGVSGVASSAAGTSDRENSGVPSLLVGVAAGAMAGAALTAVVSRRRGSRLVPGDGGTSTSTPPTGPAPDHVTIDVLSSPMRG